MNASDIATKLGVGLATGVSTMLIVAILFIPVSWVGNHFIYHSKPMRVILMLATLAVAPFVFFFLIVRAWGIYLFSENELSHTWYFGLFPLTTRLFEGGEGWFFKICAYIGNLFRKPLYGDITTDEGKHYKALIHRIYPGPPKEMQSRRFDLKEMPFEESNHKKGITTAKLMKITPGYVCEELFEAARYAASIDPIVKNKPEDEAPAPPVEWKKLMSELSTRSKYMYAIPGGDAGVPE
jgi:hypothetical protein